MLNLVALFRVLGPLLITVVQMLSDSLRFAAIIGVVIFGYANGFYSLIHFGVTSEYISSLDFDFSYLSIVTQMCLWLTGQPNLDMIAPLSGNVQVGASVLFWSFIITSYFVLLNLLIAIFNTTYERILSNSVAEVHCPSIQSQNHMMKKHADVISLASPPCTMHVLLPRSGCSFGCGQPSTSKQTQQTVKVSVHTMSN